MEYDKNYAQALAYSYGREDAGPPPLYGRSESLYHTRVRGRFLATVESNNLDVNSFSDAYERAMEDVFEELKV